MSAALHWTIKIPTEPGWYWHKCEDCYLGVVRLREGADLTEPVLHVANEEFMRDFEIHRRQLPDALVEALWAGPIPEPKETA